jgi:murein L,D-transpeptidase YcbB/YkuD
VIRRAAAVVLAAAGVLALPPPTGAAVPAVAPAPQRAQELRLGARGPAVRALQTTLARLSYLPAAGVDGVFGQRTWHSVVAFQGWTGLPRDGIAGVRTRTALAHAGPPTPWSRTTGLEVHIPQQVLLLVSSGRVVRAIHVSTGAGGATPLGRFAIVGRDPMSWSVPFGVWLPWAQYFHGGYALHEYPIVPAYPASHGCVRVSAAEAATVWQFGRAGMRVWTSG